MATSLREPTGALAPHTLRQEPLPIGRAAQRAVEAAWADVVRAAPATSSAPSASVLRRTIASSWRRSQAAGVTPLLPAAPIVHDADGLVAVREQSDWLSELGRVLTAQRDGYIGAQHMLAVFDDTGCMLTADGDPRALEQLARINFAPGALWSEAAVGTNGPGTALALRRPVHVVGAEHYCEQWQAWHCASVPVHDPESGALLGAIDLSGHRDAANPYALTMATAIAVALEQRLAAREGERRTALLLAYARLVARYPSDVVLAVDRLGRVLVDSGVDGRDARRLAALGDEGRQMLALSVAASRAEAATARELTDPRLGTHHAVMHPVLHEGRVVAGCLVLPRRSAAVPRGSWREASSPAGDPSPGSSRQGDTRRPDTRHPTSRHTEARHAETRHPTSRHTETRHTETRHAADRPASRVRPNSVRYHLDDLIGNAPAMRDVRRVARACARTDLPVLLLGESGTGKEVLAQAIHDESPRREGPFVAVNCAALPRELMESELFGHVAGAFTGARREGTVGKFQAAEGGTLFLDEVAELSPEAQAALLRVLQEGEVTRLGEHVARALDVRVIAATNRDVQAAVASGRLRDDLYHRLDVLGITLPPLRERREDIPHLVARFLDTAPHAGPHQLAAAVVSTFQRYPWPGNVRELRNVVHRMVALADSPQLGVHDLPMALQAYAPSGGSSELAREAGTSAPGVVPNGSESCAPFATRRPSIAPATAVHDLASHTARAELEAVIARHATMADAAAALGITRSTLYRRLQRHGLVPGRSVRAR